MEEDNKRVIAFLNSITNVSIKNFEDRLRLQKLVFLARKMGLDFGFSFSWYARGPYSPSLTRVLFSADELGLLECKDIQPSENEKKVAKNIKQFLGNDVENPRYLELLASVWYFINEKEISEDENKEILNTLLELKPQFTKDELEQAIKRIISWKRTNIL